MIGKTNKVKYPAMPPQWGGEMIDCKGGIYLSLIFGKGNLGKNW